MARWAAPSGAGSSDGTTGPAQVMGSGTFYVVATHTYTVPGPMTARLDIGGGLPATTKETSASRIRSEKRIAFGEHKMRHQRPYLPVQKSAMLC